MTADKKEGTSRKAIGRFRKGVCDMLPFGELEDDAVSRQLLELHGVAGHDMRIF